FLRLLQPSGSTSAWTSITREGFPSSLAPPAAMPVVLAGGRIHVVESFGVRRAVQGVEWGLESDGWWGQNLASAAFDRSTGPVAGRIAGLAAGPHGTRTVLVSRGGSLYLYRAPRPLGVRVQLSVAVGEDSVLLSGRVRGVSIGHVELSCVSAGGRQPLGSV